METKKSRELIHRLEKNVRELKISLNVFEEEELREIFKDDEIKYNITVDIFINCMTINEVSEKHNYSTRKIDRVIREARDARK